MTTVWPWTPGLPQAPCQGHVDHGLCVAMTLDERGFCAHCQKNPPRPEKAPGYVEPEDEEELRLFPEEES